MTYLLAGWLLPPLRMMFPRSILTTESVGRAMLAVPGIGPWTAALVGLRGLADPDVWLPGDLALRRSLAALGSSDTDAAGRWQPWRSYAVMHLWALAVPSLFTRAPDLRSAS